MKKVIAITGSIGSGKTTISNYIRDYNYKVYDVDKMAHELLLERKIKEKISKVFGDLVIENDEVNRKKLGNIVFNDKKKLEELNNIIHPELILKIKQIIKLGESPIFFDIPLLFELKLEKLFTKIICVYVDYDEQIKRIKKRDNRTIKEINKMIESQLPIDYKIQHSDFVIYNDNISKEKIKKILKAINEN